VPYLVSGVFHALSRWLSGPLGLVIVAGWLPGCEELPGLEAEEAPPAAVASRSAASGDLAAYLREVVAEGTGRWGGSFEQNYAPTTLYLLREQPEDGETPSSVYDGLIRWHLGLDTDPAEKDHVLLGLTGYSRSWSGPDDPAGLGTFVDEHVQRSFVDKELQFQDLGLDGDPRKACVVLGEPAAGKSTLLEYLELDAARRALGDEAEPVPVRLVLPDLDQSAPTAEGLLNAALQRVNGSEGQFDNWEAIGAGSGRRKLVVLLDALDEVSAIDDVARAIGDLEGYPEVERLIVTSRIVNFESLGPEVRLDNRGFRVALIYGQSTSAIEKRAFGLENEGQRQRVFELLSNSRTRGLWQQVFRLPKHFDFVSETLLDPNAEIDADQLTRASLLETFVENNFLEFADQVDVSLDEIHELLSAVAVAPFLDDRPGVQGDFTDQDAYRIMGAQGDPEAERRVDDVLDAAKKVSVLKKKGEGEYKFRHKQFQEYYAARSPRLWENPAELDFGIDLRDVLLFKMDLGPTDSLYPILDALVADVRRANEGRRSVALLELALDCIEASGRAALQYREQEEQFRELWIEGRAADAEASRKVKEQEDQKRKEQRAEPVPKPNPGPSPEPETQPSPPPAPPVPQKGPVVRVPKLGLELQKVDAGFEVVRAFGSRPGFEAGIRQGDVITGMSGDPVSSIRQIRSLIKAENRAVDVQYRRGASTSTARVKLR